MRSLHNLEEVDIVGDMARAYPHIYAMLNHQQTTYLAIVVRLEGKSDLSLF